MKIFNLKQIILAVLTTFMLYSCNTTENDTESIEPTASLEFDDTKELSISEMDQYFEGLYTGSSSKSLNTNNRNARTTITRDFIGRALISIVFNSTDEQRELYNNTPVNERQSFTPIFENTIEALHDVFAESVGQTPEEFNYETNIIGLDAGQLAAFLAETDAIQVAPNAPTAFFDPANGAVLTGRQITEDVTDISLTLLFGGANGTRLDGNNNTPQLISDGVGTGTRSTLPRFPFLGRPLQQ